MRDMALKLPRYFYSWSLLLRSVSVLSGGTVQLQNMYSCNLKVTGQVGAKSHVCKGYRGKLVGGLAPYP